jgi:hypothetical protein
LTPGGGDFPPMSFGGKNMKRGREKLGICKRKNGENVKEKGRKANFWTALDNYCTTYLNAYYRWF